VTDLIDILLVRHGESESNAGSVTEGAGSAVRTALGTWQAAAVAEGLARGLAVVVDDRNPDRAAQAIAATCLDASALARLRHALSADAFEPGNRWGAEAIIACERC